MLETGIDVIYNILGTIARSESLIETPEEEAKLSLILLSKYIGTLD